MGKARKARGEEAEGGGGEGGGGEGVTTDERQMAKSGGRVAPSSKTARCEDSQRATHSLKNKNKNKIK